VRAHVDVLREHSAAPPAPYLVVRTARIVRKGEHPDGSATIIARSLPIEAVTYADADGRYYGISSAALVRVDPASGQIERLSRLPSFRDSTGSGGCLRPAQQARPGDTLWHTGVHHIYDPASGAWAAIPIDQTQAA